MFDRVLNTPLNLTFSKKNYAIYFTNVDFVNQTKLWHTGEINGAKILANDQLTKYTKSVVPNI